MTSAERDDSCRRAGKRGRVGEVTSLMTCFPYPRRLPDVSVPGASERTDEHHDDTEPLWPVSLFVLFLLRETRARAEGFKRFSLFLSPAEEQNETLAADYSSKVSPIIGCFWIDPRGPKKVFRLVIFSPYPTGPDISAMCFLCVCY